MTAPKPKPAAVPEDTFDLDASRAARREAAQEPFRFVFGGQPFTLPPSKEWPLVATDALADGHIGDAMKELLAEQWDTFAAMGATVGDLTALFGAVSAWQGLTPGE